MEYAPIIILVLTYFSVMLGSMGAYLLITEKRRRAKDRLDSYTKTTESNRASNHNFQVLRDRRLSRFQGLDNFLQSNRLADTIALQLLQARIALRVGEYLIISVACSVAMAYLLFSLSGALIAAPVGAVVGLLAPQFYVRRKRSQRTKALESQLVDSLSLVANSLRAGWGFMQSIGQISNRMAPPISEEFTQLMQEVNLGTSAEESIQSLVRRTPSYDLELAMTAVLIQRQVGGNLAEMMDIIAYTIRERLRLLGDIASIISESRLSMWLLSLLPVFLVVIMSIVQPDYMLPFLMDPRGRILLLGAAVLEVIGVMIMRKISNINV